MKALEFIYRKSRYCTLYDWVVGEAGRNLDFCKYQTCVLDSKFSHICNRKSV